MPSPAPWYWRSLPLENRTGSEVFDRLFRTSLVGTQGWRAIATLLESPASTSHLVHSSQPPSLARYSICAGPPRLVLGRPCLWTPGLGQVLPTLRSLLKESFHPHPQGPEELPFVGGWLGWLGYDVAWEIEHLPHRTADSLPFPIAFWYEPEEFAVLDHEHQQLWLAVTRPLRLDDLVRRLESPDPTHPLGTQAQGTHAGALPLQISFVSSQAEYETAVLKAQNYIHAGDIFQANLSLRFSTPTSADSWPIYQALQRVNPSPFASYWQTPWGAVISASPERLIQLQDGLAQTRPIAGTRPRGRSPAADQALARELRDNTKENAEHIMLVDLERNDLGRVCQWGTVEVDELLTIERYSHVMHLVSNVRGQLRSPYNAIDLIRALFPGGTITGCPKVRCMEIIEELEPVRRSLFYGSCGYLDQRGHLDLNILIRTLLWVSDQPDMDKFNGSQQQFRLGTRTLAPLHRVWGQIGAGIVADSEPEREWHESLLKAQAQLEALHTVLHT